MNRPSFFEGVAVAFIASLLLSTGLFVVSSVLFSDFLVYLLTAIAGISYIIYLTGRSGEKTGRITVILIWSLTSIASLLFFPSPLVFALTQLGFVWLVRSLYYYNSVVAALLDMGLMAAGIAIALWTWFYSHSTFLSLWCFFLTQALFVVIPSSLQSSKTAPAPETGNQIRFERAHQAAMQAVRKLANHA